MVAGQLTIDQIPGDKLYHAGFVTCSAAFGCQNIKPTPISFCCPLGGENGVEISPPRRVMRGQ